MVVTEVMPQAGRPDRRVHALTDAGREELHAWLRSPIDAPAPKEPFLARLFFAELAWLADVRDAVERERL